MRPANTEQLRKLKARLGAIPASVREAVAPELKASGDALVAEMKRLAPKDSGALAESITLTTAGKPTPPNALGGAANVVPENQIAVTAGNATVFYAPMVEFGTSRAHAQPFFLPAYRAMRQKIRSDLHKAIVAAAKGAKP